jgi:periplasmic protein TonB
MEIKQVLNADLDDIIFENRNKEYGAYDMRKKYMGRVLIALLISVFFIATFSLEPEIQKLIFKEKAYVPPVVHVTKVNTLSSPPPREKPPPPPDIPPPPPPKTMAFVPPKVVKEKVEEEKPPVVKDLLKTQVSTTTTTGSTELQPQGPKKVEPEVKKVEPEQIFESVDEVPEFPGGYEAYIKYLQSKINYPAQAIDAGAQGTVYISMLVDVNGNISDVKIKKDPVHYGCGEEAIKAIKASPPWKPGKINGKAVKVRYTIPVKFVLPH